MKILVLSSTYPYPLDTGSRNLIFHWIRSLSQRHQVDLLVVSSDALSTGDNIPGLAGVAVETVQAVPGRGLRERIARFARSWWKGIPAYALVVTTEEIVRKVCSLVQAGRYDVVVLAENNVAGYAPLLKRLCPVVLFKHSVHLSDAEDDRRRFGGNSLRWAIAKSVTRRFERASCSAADVLCTVTEDDAQELGRLYGVQGPIRVVPIGVDLGAFPPRAQDPGGKVIAFYGNLTWGANVDAVLWFAREVFPRVLAKHPAAVFRVIGASGEALQKLVNHPRVKFPGRAVPITGAVQDATVGVVPVISGTGMRFKLVEMLSMGIPTVTTTLGMVGTECIHGQHALIADESEFFAAAVVRLLEEPQFREAVSRNAVELARRYSWDSVAPKILEAVESAVRSSPKGDAH